MDNKKFNSWTIDKILRDNLKVNTRGQIRGQNKVVDKIHRAHLKSVDDHLMDIRIYVAKISTGHSTKEALKMIDEFIYKKTI